MRAGRVGLGMAAEAHHFEQLLHRFAKSALEIIRGCWGLDLVGCDLVEVSPPYDTTGNTAITAANLLFEMLCVLPGVERRTAS